MPLPQRSERTGWRLIDGAPNVVSGQPDVLPALVWALTELLVELNDGFYELTRQRVEEMRQQQTAPEPPKPVYARGSVEWSRQQAEAEETNR